MLAYILALLVGLGSFVLYLSAFFFPEIHRKHDFIWSGVAMFYALVLWVCAGRITGGVLIGQTASVALLGWLGWQTLWLRRQSTPSDQQTPLPDWQMLQSKLAQWSSPEQLSQLPNQAQLLWQRLQTSLKAVLSQRPQVKTQPTIPGDPQGLDSSLKITDSTTPAEGELSTSQPQPAVTKGSPVDATVPKSLEVDPWAEVPEPSEPVTAVVVVKDAKSAIAKAGINLTERIGHWWQIVYDRPLAILQDLWQSTLGSRSKTTESKPVYVRKQFRTSEAEAPETPVSDAQGGEDEWGMTAAVVEEIQDKTEISPDPDISDTPAAITTLETTAEAEGETAETVIAPGEAQDLPEATHEIMTAEIANETETEASAEAETTPVEALTADAEPETETVSDAEPILDAATETTAAIDSTEAAPPVVLTFDSEVSTANESSSAPEVDASTSSTDPEPDH
ncbi:Ycf66 family protein [Neosynechococcus sphagnicola]|uniref:Ycf66 family protein n=1 Tax=Neosynechococcus sphagnicola TaxID=1501145 RepID=UPI000691542C|nr:Ycf66 family protein [Neosynechococcus sphagnicola]